MFLHVLKEGDAESGLGESVSSHQLENFESTVSALSQSEVSSASQQVDVNAVLRRISSYHSRMDYSISTAATPLTKLIQSHASFPFQTDSQANLRPDQLLKAVLLLTSNCEKLFRAAGWTGDEITIRERTANQRIAFIFESLAEPPSRSSYLDDVVDVLCRIPYPRVKDSSGDLARRNIQDLVPVAQRLLEQDDGSRLFQDGRIPRDTYRQLTALIAATNGDQITTIVGNQHGVNKDEFTKWAIKVHDYPSLLCIAFLI